MQWVLIATGFTGALTLVFLLRRAYKFFVPPAETEVFFSPKGGCQDAIVRELKRARKEILVQAYSFTADPITYGLVEAKKRGVHVEILLDRSNEEASYSDLHILVENQVPILIDAKACDRTQQDHGRRSEGCPHGQLQLHQPGRTRKRGKLADPHAPPRSGEALPGKLPGRTRAILSLHRTTHRPRPSHSITKQPELGAALRSQRFAARLRRHRPHSTRARD